jgi:hypothetical protein
MGRIERDATGSVVLRSGAWLALLATATMSLASAQPGTLSACAVCALYDRAPAGAAAAAQGPQADAALPGWAVARHRAAVRETRVALGSVDPW